MPDGDRQLREDPFPLGASAVPLPELPGFETDEEILAAPPAVVGDEFDLDLALPPTPDIAQLAAPADLLAAPPVIKPPAADLGQLAQAPALLPPTALDGFVGEQPPVSPGAEPPAEFEPVAVSPFESVTAAGEALRAANDVVGERGQDVAALQGRKNQLQRALAMARTDKQRAKATEKLGEVQRALTGAEVEQADARDEAVTADAVQQNELARASVNAQNVAVTQATADADKVRTDAEAKLKRSLDNEEFAKGDRDTSIAEYQRVLSTGPQRSMGIAIADVITEAMNARLERRTPNFGKVFAQNDQRTRAVWKDKQTAALAKVRQTGDRITDMANERRAGKADAAERETAIFDRAIAQAERQVRLATSDADAARATGLVDQLQQARDARAGEAAAARLEMGQAFEERAAALELTRAKTAKEQAAAAKIGAEADKVARRGKGGGRAPLAGLIAPNIVAVPGTDEALVTFPDDAKGRKEAQATRDIVGEQQSFLETMNSIEAFYEDADKQGLISSIGIRGSDANQRLGVLIGVAKAKLAQIKAGPGKATTKDDEKWAEDFVPENPKAWSNRERGLKRLKAATSVFEDESRSILQRTTRLDTPTRERLVREARKRGVSRTQRAKLEASRASSTVVDDKADAEARLKAVDLIEENARAEAGDQWLSVATDQTAAALAKVTDTDVRNKLVKKLQQFKRFSRDRAANIYGALGGGDIAKAGFLTGSVDARIERSEQIKTHRAIEATIDKAQKANVSLSVDQIENEAVKQSVKAFLGLDSEGDDDANR